MEKLYDRIEWHNNTTPAINETNLNLMSKAIDDIDDRVVEIAADVLVTVPQIQEDLEEAQELLEDAQEISTHPPIIGQNGNWWTWDTSIDDYADSGVDAGVSLTIGTTSTLTPGSDATVTNSGTATDPILNFGIPAGVAGQNGQDGADGADGVSPTVTIGTITGGHSVTITDADHPTGQSFNVMDGEDGVGIPSGGTTGQVLKKKSGTNYDTEWGEGSGGHTILNGSGSAMNQRGKLQFNGAAVTDDSTNDKTIVTTTPQSMIGDAWVTSHAYAVGDYCIDGNVLYKCKTAHTSSASYRPPYASYWDAVSVASQLDKGTYNVGDKFIVQDSGNFNGSFKAILRTCNWENKGKNIYVFYDLDKPMANDVKSATAVITNSNHFVVKSSAGVEEVLYTPTISSLTVLISPDRRRIMLSITITNSFSTLATTGVGLFRMNGQTLTITFA